MRMKIINDKENCSLVITNPEKEDTGDYRCEANGVPTSCHLTVIGKIIIIVEQLNITRCVLV
jgi:hypothetical protein